MNRRSFLAAAAVLPFVSPLDAKATSYFSPGNGTVNFDYEPGLPVVTGEQRNMVVVCADPKTVWGIVDGAVAWHRTEVQHVRGAMTFEGMVLYGCGKQIKAVNPATGFVWRTWTFQKHVTALWAGHLTNGPTLAVGYETLGGPDPQVYANHVELFQIAGDDLQSIHLVAEPINNARGLYVQDGRVVIAETFGRRVVVTKVSTGYLEKSTWVTYPNDVRPLPDGRVLVTSEHGNRIFKWDPVTDARELVLGAPVAPFNDITTTRDEIEAAISDTAAVAPGYSPVYDPPKQNVAQEYHPGAISLYAPNCALLDDAGHLIVADTDNSRVIAVRDGTIVTEVRLNNPVNVALF